MKWLVSTLVITVANPIGLALTPAASTSASGPGLSVSVSVIDEQAQAPPATKPTDPVLMPIVERGDFEAVRALLAKGADPNEFEVMRAVRLSGPQFTSKSPLLIAVKNGNEPIARLLLEHGARARWRDANGMTVTEVARARKSSDALIELLSAAEKRDFTLVPQWPLPEPLALVALSDIARRGTVVTTDRQLDPVLLQRVSDIVEILSRTWTRPKERPPVLAWSLTRDVNSLEWAIQNRRNDTLGAVVSDLETKRQDCQSSPDGAFGEVKISVRTLLGDGTERRGLRIRYIERFYWDLLTTMPVIANQWKELAATTSVVAEPLTAGDYMIVARSADGKDLSEAKQISVRRNGTTQFDVSLR